MVIHIYNNIEKYNINKDIIDNWTININNLNKYTYDK